MASFTDQVPQLAQFNPYVAQLPIEAMVSVGQQKQEQYNQGVEKIQASYDQIAGLDVIRDVDKQYLQSKLDSVESNLRNVAAADFSNHQLVNSVGGMIKGLAKDKKIQNAVGSTMQFREQLQQIKEDEEKGVSNPNNTNYFYKHANSWLSGKEAGEPLQEKYFKPVDVWSKIKDIAKEVGIDEQMVQEMYQTDSKGNRLYNTDSKGNPTTPKINMVMVEKHLKGKDPSKLLLAFKNALTPLDYKQLSIDGEMGKASLSQEDLIKDVTYKTQNQINSADLQLRGLELSLQNEKARDVKNLENIKSLEKQIEYFSSYKTDLEKSQKDNIQNVLTNPDQVRANLHINDYLDSMSKALSSQQETTINKENPAWQANMEWNKFQRDLQNDKIKNNQWKFDYDQKERELTAKGLKDLSKVDKTYDAAVPTQTDDTFYKLKTEQEFSNNLDKLNSTNSRIVYEKYRLTDPSASPNKINELIAADAQRDGLSVDAYKAKIANNEVTNFNKNIDNSPSEFGDLLKEQSNLVKSINIQKSKIDNVKKQALEIAAREGKNVITPEEIDKKLKEADIYVPSLGSKFKLSKQDVVDFARIYQGESKINLFTPKEDLLIKDQAQKRLLQKYGEAYKDIENTVFTLEKSKIQTPQINPVYLKTIPEIENASALLQQSSYKNLAKIESDLYQKMDYTGKPQIIPVVLDEKTKAEKVANLSAILKQYPKQDNISEGYSYEKANELLNDSKANVSWTVAPGQTSSDPNAYVLNIAGKNGENINVTVDEKTFETFQGYKYNSVRVPEVLQKLKESGTTNLTHTGNPETPFWNSSDFKNYKEKDYTLGADLEPSLLNPDFVWLKIFKYDNNGKVVDTYTYPKKEDGPIPKYLKDDSINPIIENLPLGINEQVLQGLKQK